METQTSFYIEEQLKIDFQKWCLDNKTNMGEQLNKMIIELLKRG